VSILEDIDFDGLQYGVIALELVDQLLERIQVLQDDRFLVITQHRPLRGGALRSEKPFTGGAVVLHDLQQANQVGLELFEFAFLVLGPDLFLLASLVLEQHLRVIELAVTTKTTLI
jgi:hypothetical protein